MSSALRLPNRGLSGFLDRLFGRAAIHPNATAQQSEGQRLEPIKRLMLDALELGAASKGKSDIRVQRIAYRIGLCKDAQTLWYLRSDVMQVMSARLGEREARSNLDDISELFDGLLPRSLNSRPAPLR